MVIYDAARVRRSGRGVKMREKAGDAARVRQIGGFAARVRPYALNVSGLPTAAARTVSGPANRNRFFWLPVFSLAARVGFSSRRGVGERIGMFTFLFAVFFVLLCLVVQFALGWSLVFDLDASFGRSCSACSAWVARVNLAKPLFFHFRWFSGFPSRTTRWSSSFEDVYNDGNLCHVFRRSGIWEFSSQVCHCLVNNSASLPLSGQQLCIETNFFLLFFVGVGLNFLATAPPSGLAIYPSVKISSAR
jgi:hypothetical protein